MYSQRGEHNKFKYRFCQRCLFISASAELVKVNSCVNTNIGGNVCCNASIKIYLHSNRVNKVEFIVYFSCCFQSRWTNTRRFYENVQRTGGKAVERVIAAPDNKNCTHIFRRSVNRFHFVILYNLFAHTYK